MNSYSMPGVNRNQFEAEFIVRRFQRGLSGKGEMEVVMLLVTEFYDISEKDIKSASRKRPICWPRHVFCYLCYKFVKCSVNQIADFINKDHTSIIHAKKNVSNLMDSDPDLNYEVKFLESKYVNSKIVGKL